jgi:hypothetical protein
MRITESRIRQIIREEAQRALRPTARRLRERAFDDDGEGEGGSGAEAFLTIFNISEIADAMDMGVEDFQSMMEDVIERRFRGKVTLSGGDSGGWGPEPEPYDHEQDSIGALGSRRDLERFVSELEGEIQGPAQSIEDGEGLDYEITDL